MKGTEHIILAVFWQILKQFMTKDIDLKHVPEIIRLAEEDEEMTDLLKLPAEKILIRWMNFHLANSGDEKRIKNLAKDVQDGKAYALVLNQLDKDSCPKDVAAIEDDAERAEKVIEAAEKIGVKVFITGKDINSGNKKLNTVFTSNIFNHKHGLEELTEEEYEAAGIIDDDIEGSLEER